MTWVIVGLGNPGEEYESTRHNAGRTAAERFASDASLQGWKNDKKAKATIAKGVLRKALILAVLPDTFMNNSGDAVARYVKSAKAAEKMIVAYDDLDLPLGTVKVSFDRGSGGHRGLESVMKSVRSRKFARVRIGISPHTAAGKIKKPQGEAEVADFILKKFKKGELEELKDIFKRASGAIEAIIEEGVPIAMNKFN